MRLVLLLIAALLMTAPANAEQPAVKRAAKPAEETKDMFWLFSLSGHSPLGDSLLGTSAGIHVGVGSFFSRGFYELGLDILSGPYQSTGGLGTDYNGTGIGGQVGWHLGPGKFRHRRFSAGLVLGAEYSDVTGTRFSRDGDGEISRQNLRVIRYLAVPGLYIGYWRKPRPEGNEVELLDTRIEGAILSLSLSLPVFNHLQRESGSTTRREGDESDDSLDQSFIKFGVQVFLGV